MHYSMPNPPLNLIRSHSSNSRGGEGGISAMRFGSMPVTGMLLSDIQAQRALEAGDREPWQHQLHNQVLNPNLLTPGLIHPDVLRLFYFPSTVQYTIGHAYNKVVHNVWVETTECRMVRDALYLPNIMSTTTISNISLSYDKVFKPPIYFKDSPSIQKQKQR